MIYLVHKLKFSLNDFKELDLPDLLINISCYSEGEAENSLICKQYKEYCIIAARKKVVSVFS